MFVPWTVGTVVPARMGAQFPPSEPQPSHTSRAIGPLVCDITRTSAFWAHLNREQLPLLHFETVTYTHGDTVII